MSTCSAAELVLCTFALSLSMLKRFVAMEEIPFFKSGALKLRPTLLLSERAPVISSRGALCSAAADTTGPALNNKVNRALDRLQSSEHPDVLTKQKDAIFSPSLGEDYPHGGPRDLTRRRNAARHSTSSRRHSRRHVYTRSFVKRGTKETLMDLAWRGIARSARHYHPLRASL